MILSFVGNKADILEGREVSKEDGESYAKEHKGRYFESSAKTGDGVQEAVSGVCEEIFKKVKSGEIKTNFGENGVIKNTSMFNELSTSMGSNKFKTKARFGKKKKKSCKC